ncbi:hypothetical protein JCM15519_10320 [Fundidesulfovibrio butyratiphilus]
MSLRIKFLCLLLALSVLPLVGLRLRGQQVLEDVARTLADNSAQTLLEKAMALTLVQVQGQAALLRREGELLEQTVRLQALEVEKALPQPGVEGIERAHQAASRGLGDIVAKQATALLDGRVFPLTSADPRLPSWLNLLKDATGPVWSLPRPEPDAERVPLTVSCPVRDREGRFAGATALMAALDLKNRRNGLSVLSPVVSVYLVYPEKLGSRGDGLLVLGRNEARPPNANRAPKTNAPAPRPAPAPRDEQVGAQSTAMEGKRLPAGAEDSPRRDAPSGVSAPSGGGADAASPAPAPPAPDSASAAQGQTGPPVGATPTDQTVKPTVPAANSAAPAATSAGPAATSAAPAATSTDPAAISTVPAATSAGPAATSADHGTAPPPGGATTSQGPGNAEPARALPVEASPSGRKASAGAQGPSGSVSAKTPAADSASDWFTLDSPEAQARLLAAVKSHEPGRFEALFRKRQQLVAFAPLGVHEVALVYVLPMEEITAEAQASRAFIDRTVADQLQATGYMAGLALAAVILAAWLVARGLSGPILQLDRAARRVAAGDLDVKVHPAGGGEMESLGRAFNLMVPELREKVRLSQAMVLAQQVQHGLLPMHLPQPPGLDVAAVSQPCEETGGDYFDAVENARATPGVTALVLGDVSGHGVDAALYMTTARAYLRLRAQQPGDPAQVVGDVNRFLTRDTHGSGRFMTLFYLEVDDSGLRYVRAGHDPALVYDPATNDFEELTGQGPPLGIGSDFTYECVSRPPLSPGQVLLVVSDGLWEARNPAGEMFGKERVRQALRQHAHLGAHALLDALLGVQDVFREGRPVRDDVTLLAVKAVDGEEKE